MHKVIFSIIALLWTFSSLGHDIRMAHYTVHVADEKVLCDARIDIHDFRLANDTFQNDCDLNEYFKDHLSFNFDGQPIELRTVNHTISENWIKVRFELQTSTRQPDKIDVFNDLLTSKVNGHDNIMRFLFHGRTRVFRLNENRQQISFKY